MTLANEAMHEIATLHSVAALTQTIVQKIQAAFGYDRVCVALLEKTGLKPGLKICATAQAPEIDDYTLSPWQPEAESRLKAPEFPGFGHCYEDAGIGRRPNEGQSAFCGSVVWIVIQDLKPVLKRLRHLAPAQMDSRKTDQYGRIPSVQLVGALKIGVCTTEIPNVEAGGSKIVVERKVLAIEKHLRFKKRYDFREPTGSK